jgi:hypothetical protein
LKRATDKAKKEYLENICNEITVFQRTGRYDLMYMKTKELGWRETQGIRNIGIEDSQGNIACLVTGLFCRKQTQLAVITLLTKKHSLIN